MAYRIEVKKGRRGKHENQLKIKKQKKLETASDSGVEDEQEAIN